MPHKNRTNLVALFVLTLAVSFSSCGNPATNLPQSSVSSGGSSNDPAGGETGEGTGGSDSSSGGSSPSTGGTSPATGGAGGMGPVGGCSFTPNANAGDASLRFDQIELSFDTDPGNKGGPNGLIGIHLIPGTENEFLLLQKGGTVRHVSIGESATSATLIGTYTVDSVNNTQDCGLVAAAFDPDFETNQLVYFGHCYQADATRVSRYTFTGDALSDRQDIVTWSRGGSGSSWHSVGSIMFDADKNLLVLHGEFTNTAATQDMNSGLGKLLRLVPNREAGQGGYMAATGNPNFNDDPPTNAIWASGLRSPWKGYVNSHGHVVFGDVGPDAYEEVNVVTGPGMNFGWGMSGNPTGPCDNPCVSPVTAWHKRNADEATTTKYRNEGNPVTGARAGAAVWVGIEYGDCGSDRYQGALTGVGLFGDLFRGWVRGMVLDSQGQMTVDKSLGHLPVASGWAQGSDGYLYATTYGGPYDSIPDTDESGLYRAVLDN